MKKETTHPAIGSKVRLINKPVWVGAYKEGETGVVVGRDVFGDAALYGHILVVLDKGVDYTYNIPHGQYEVIQGTPQDILNADNTVLSINSVEETSAESLRNTILDIRSKREVLKKEILQLDEQEKEAVDKLKEQGFVLYEQNVVQTLDGRQALVATENKAVLYAYEIEEDMTSPENWEVGDLIEAINNSSDSAYRAGEVYEISWLQWQLVDDCVVSTSLDSNECSTNGWGSTNFKFHSRPVK